MSLAAAAPKIAAPMNARTQRLLTAPILPTLLSLAWPNVLVMLAQASTGLIETWWVSKLGPDALAGVALVFPGAMMMGMLSAGAVGGGVASAVARALGEKTTPTRWWLMRCGFILCWVWRPPLCFSSGGARSTPAWAGAGRRWMRR